MPAHLVDLTGERYGRLVVLERAENAGKATRWLCRCDCGEEKIIRAAGLRGKAEGRRTRSCGCLRSELAASKGRRTHEQSGHPLYHRWSAMRRRCNNPKNSGYVNYGARGIYVCAAWNDSETGFRRFVEDVGPLPSPAHSLDRIDNDGPYSPENCRWALPLTQVHNQRPRVRNAQHAAALTRIAELEAENARLLSLIPYDAQEAA